MTLILEIGAVVGLATFIKSRETDNDEDFDKLIRNTQNMIHQSRSASTIDIFTSQKHIIKSQINELFRLIPPESKFHMIVYVLRNEYNKMLEIENHSIKTKQNDSTESLICFLSDYYSIMTRLALITGITGQDGSYLAELLLSKEYIVYGVIRRHSSIHTERINHIYNKLRLLYGDMTDQTSIQNVFNTIRSEHKLDDIEVLEVYNLAAQSHVKVSFEVPEYTGQVDALGTLRLLESIMKSPLRPVIRYYQASTSELFGDVVETPQNEQTPFNPQSPYAIAKMYSYWITKNYRTSYGLYACNGILFNHTGPRRGETFVCRKTSIAVAKIMRNKQDVLQLGNLDAKRDFGSAEEYVEGMWRMMQLDEPTDMVLCSEVMKSVREIVEICFGAFGKQVVWKGSGLDEVGEVDGVVRVVVNEKYFRPAEVNLLIGDCSYAKQMLGWVPGRTVEDIFTQMVKYDYEHC